MSRPQYSLPNLRRFLGACVVTAFLVTAVAAYYGTPEPLPASVDTTSDAAAATGGPADQAPATVTIEPEPTAAGVELPSEGPGVSEPGLLLIAAPLPDGTWDVSEQVMLAKPTTSLTLAPADISRAGSQFGFARPEATSVQVSVGEQPVVIPEARVIEQVSADIPSTTRFEISYRLDGATVTTVPSTARRGIGAIMPVTSGLDPDLPVVVMVVGETVLSLSCPELSLSERNCGTAAGDEAMILAEPLPFGAAVVAAQIDIPRL
ncbi:hypothetical protein K0651_06270 [Ornithinimicrobium sp. Arc0846-15]|nr:hypothetical protein [Ornithinimicrobium laminariae]